MAVLQEQGQQRKDDNPGLATRDLKKTSQKMMVAVGDGLSDLASSENGEEGEHKDDEKTEQGQLSKDDEPGWVMGTTRNTVQQRMERFH